MNYPLEIWGSTSKENMDNLKNDFNDTNDVNNKCVEQMKHGLDTHILYRRYIITHIHIYGTKVLKRERVSLKSSI